MSRWTDRRDHIEHHQHQLPDSDPPTSASLPNRCSPGYASWYAGGGYVSRRGAPDTPFHMEHRPGGGRGTGCAPQCQTPAWCDFPGGRCAYSCWSSCCSLSALGWGILVLYLVFLTAWIGRIDSEVEETEDLPEARFVVDLRPWQEVMPPHAYGVQVESEVLAAFAQRRRADWEDEDPEAAHSPVVPTADDGPPRTADVQYAPGPRTAMCCSNCDTQFANVAQISCLASAWSKTTLTLTSGKDVSSLCFKMLVTITDVVDPRYAVWSCGTAPKTRHRNVPCLLQVRGPVGPTDRDAEGSVLVEFPLAHRNVGGTTPAASYSGCVNRLSSYVSEVLRDDPSSYIVVMLGCPERVDPRSGENSVDVHKPCEMARTHLGAFF